MRILVLAITLAACGSPSTSNPDAPTTHDAQAHDAPSPDASGPRTGVVTISAMHGPGVSAGDATAQFTVGSIYGELLGTDGACSLFRNPADVGLSAGTITITGTTMPITLTPSGPPVTYDASTVPDPPFTPGAMLTATATGAELPAFTASVTAPATLAGFTAPASISRAAGYHATWTQDGGQMWLLVGASPSAHEIDVLLCKVPDTGSYTVTPAALALFPPAITTVNVGLARAGETDVHIGADEIDVVAFDMLVSTGSTTLAP